ncbi:D-alanyl-D-alanine carboxypeptidase [Streptomyces sp. AK02-01A]|uniref:D-alanyl-D-alanine carboxypeptidase n=1 Tax=Streptomyces sp. AK02-01A TaxID=3028648 RepID=UPI0029A258F4|nr:D-alanyl-D-alanine carboxypeptidase [Streptomyces sp. AK02-01A]MDX3853429.1 D-alanyl-D-alanine carboxypeptidase [Streptomyces sp. AK02-01A]
MAGRSPHTSQQNDPPTEATGNESAPASTAFDETPTEPSKEKSSSPTDATEERPAHRADDSATSATSAAASALSSAKSPAPGPSDASRPTGDSASSPPDTATDAADADADADDGTAAENNTEATTTAAASADTTSDITQQVAAPTVADQATAPVGPSVGRKTGDSANTSAGPASNTPDGAGDPDADAGTLVAVNSMAPPQATPPEPAADNRPELDASMPPAKAETAATDQAPGTFSGQDGAGTPAEGQGPEQDARPPLDLLAQLTNTPAPPASRTRTLARRIKIWTPLVALLVLVFLTVQILRPLPEPAFVLGETTSSFTVEGSRLSIPWPAKGQAAVTVVGSGTIGTSGEEKPVPTASIAKIMTAYVILRDHPLQKDEKGPQITVDAQTVEDGKSEDESRIEGLDAGQAFGEQDMLKMLMIPSGNNIARLLARWDTGSQDETAFVGKMNDAAKALGMKNTIYTDPSGLDKETVSTAVDQLKLAEEVMKSDAFRAIVALPNADIPGLGRIYNNNDRLIMAGLSIRGIKTGSNTPAGGTLSWAAYKTVDGKDRLILGTMMEQRATGADPNGANSLVLVQDNSKRVIEAVRNALTSATAVSKGQVLGYVDDGLGGQTPVVATEDLKAVGVPGQKLRLTVSNGDIPRTAKAGAVFGELAVGTGAEAHKVPVAFKTDLTEPSLGAKLTRLG